MAKKKHRTSDEPRKISFESIRKITDDFSELRKIGSGGFGTVYKGVLDGEDIAVKVFPKQEYYNSKFEEEFQNLRRLKHQNIVKLIGFCNETENEYTEFKGVQVSANRIHLALCLEYVHNGSLENYIADENTGFNWATRYKIIRGACEGLKYLHEGLESPLLHLDLKPENILLDKNMTPKIADFGVSRFFDEENTTESSSRGTRGYCPPEYITKKKVSKGFDIFSLGVIIVKIMTGHKGYELIDDMTTQEFVDYVHDRWRKRLGEILSPRLLEAYCQQVKRCIDIALKCITWKQRDRPTIQEIVTALIETETAIGVPVMQIEQFRKKEPILPKRETPEWPSQGLHQSSEIAIYDSEVKTQETMPSLLNTETKELPLTLLKKITDDFSEERKLGEDPFGAYYKGMQGGVAIVVKRLKEDSPVAREKAFNKEVEHIMALQHENLAKLVGFCREVQAKVVRSNGKYTVADHSETLLCYEYLPGGSLDKYIFAESSSLNWDTRFNIIKGICQGLHFLHKLDQPVIHMDLKPENILLDNNMVAKIAEFGRSRIFAKEQTRANTENIVGSYGYIAPEYYYRGEISTQADIYSLGVTIIETVIRKKNTVIPEENSSSTEKVSARKFIEKVREEWTHDHIVSVHPSLDAICLKQIKTCIEIGLECVEINRKKRPSIENIVNRLSSTFQ